MWKGKQERCSLNAWGGICVRGAGVAVQLPLNSTARRSRLGKCSESAPPPDSLTELQICRKFFFSSLQKAGVRSGCYLGPAQRAEMGLRGRLAAGA